MSPPMMLGGMKGCRWWLARGSGRQEMRYRIVNDSPNAVAISRGTKGPDGSECGSDGVCDALRDVPIAIAKSRLTSYCLQ